MGQGDDDPLPNKEVVDHVGKQRVKCDGYKKNLVNNKTGQKGTHLNHRYRNACSLGVPGLVGIELISFIAAHMVGCSGSVTKSVLITH